MTLSNFDWTDKDSVKWFMMLPTGHVGPYSLNQLARERDDKTISSNVMIWAEGLQAPVTLQTALEHDDIPEIPDLPPLPIDDELPPIPFAIEEDIPAFESISETEAESDFPPEVTESPEEAALPAETKPRKKLLIALGSLLLILGLLYLIVSRSEKFDVLRLPKMTVALHERILRENGFDGWDKKIFFKEYVPDDHTHIWLVTSGFQNCHVEANFQSLKDKMLSLKDETVSFKTKGELKGHLVEFSSFDFTNGNKIIPGLYEMDVRASNCEWDGFIPKLMNGFAGPDKSYMARTRVILFSKGAEEFNRILDKLLKKKIEVVRKEQTQNEAFWQDLQQKLETLEAVTLQIEQHMLDFLDIEPGPPGTFTKNLKVMIDQYTRKFGSFLTSFVVENENYFKNLNRDSKGASERRNYEIMVRLTAKRIGLETMKFIEEFQAIKKAPNKAELEKYSARVRNAFANIKNDIKQKLLQVSEDRSK